MSMVRHKIALDNLTFLLLGQRVQEATRVELNIQPPSLLQRDIIRCATPYVVLECGGTCDSVVDRVALTTRIADSVMTQRA
jgi:hypothetical protein